MDQATATTKYVRVPPRKARLIANLIRGLTVDAALAQLTFSQMKAGRHLKKTVNSALANFEMNFDTKGRDKKLHILSVIVNEGPRLKRIRSKCRGGRAPILKRMSHFTVVIGEKL